MNFLSYIYAFIIGVIVEVIGIILDIPSLIISILIYFIIAYFIGYTFLRMHLGKGNVKSTERFLLKSKKNPIYQLYYGLANGLEEEVDEAIQKINKRPYPSTVKKQHQLIHATFHGQIEDMEKLLKGMKRSTFTLYYQTIHSMLVNNLDEARQLIDQNPKLWMREALTAELLMKENRKEEAFNHAHVALLKTRGIQRYVLIRTWEREWGMLLNDK